jgi:acyl-CoA dehydrogenase
LQIKYLAIQKIVKSAFSSANPRRQVNAAHAMDTVGNKVAKAEIAMIKVAVPNMACQIIDWAIQVHGGGGTSNDFGLTVAYATARLLRLADGPDEVHRNQIARLELRKYSN